MNQPVVYFIEDAATGHIKIGHTTTDPFIRLSQLQVSCPGKLRLLGVLPGGLSFEAEMHARFSGCRQRGEWFERKADLDLLIATMTPPCRLRHSKTRAFWNGMSDADICRVLDVSKVSLCEIRLGKRRPSPELAMRLQRVTGISAVALVFGEATDEALQGATARPQMLRVA